LVHLSGYKFFCNCLPTRAGGAGIFDSDQLLCAELSIAYEPE